MPGVADLLDFSVSPHMTVPYFTIYKRTRLFEQRDEGGVLR